MNIQKVRIKQVSDGLANFHLAVAPFDVMLASVVLRHYLLSPLP
jgi:hypothetical protein